MTVLQIVLLLYMVWLFWALHVGIFDRYAPVSWLTAVKFRRLRRESWPVPIRATPAFFTAQNWSSGVIRRSVNALVAFTALGVAGFGVNSVLIDVNVQLLGNKIARLAAEPSDPDFIYRHTRKYQLDQLARAVGLRRLIVVSLSGARPKAD